GHVAPVPHEYPVLVEWSRGQKRLLVHQPPELDAVVVAEEPALPHDDPDLTLRIVDAVAGNPVRRDAVRGFRAQPAQRPGFLLHELIVGIDPDDPLAQGMAEGLVSGSREVVAPGEMEHTCAELLGDGYGGVR